MHSLFAQLSSLWTVGLRLRLGGGQPDLNPIWCFMLGWPSVTNDFTTGLLLRKLYSLLRSVKHLNHTTGVVMRS